MEEEKSKGPFNSDGDEDAGDDGADQHAAESLCALRQNDGDRHQRRNNHFLDRGPIPRPPLRPKQRATMMPVPYI